MVDQTPTQSSLGRIDVSPTAVLERHDGRERHFAVGDTCEITH